MKNKDLPIGSQFSSLVTVSETYMKPVSKRRRRFVDVQCQCGSPIKPVNL